jgi:lysophospholipase L1-like esterase
LGAIATLSTVASLFHFIALQWIDRWTFLTPAQVPELYVTMWIFGVVAALTAGGALVVRRRPGATVRLAQVCLLGAVVLGFFFLDRALAIAFPPPSELNSLLEPHLERGWALRRNVVGSDADVITGTNSLGLRGPEVPQPKPAGEFRILFVGDSVTFGYALTEEQTLPARVGERLRRQVPGRPIRCVNGGVSGYTTWQELDYLQSEGLSLMPDLVVLQMSLNDILDVLLVPPGRLHGRQIEFEFSNTSHWSGIVRAVTSLRARRYWHQASKDLEWIDESDRATVAKLGSFQAMFAEPPPPPVEKAWLRVLADLTAFDRLCRSRGVPWVLVVTPPHSELDPKSAHLRPQKRLRAWADAHSVLMFDPLPIIEQHGKAKGLSADEQYLDEGHPTPATMSLIAEKFAEFLFEHGLIGPRTSSGPTPPR